MLQSNKLAIYAIGKIKKLWIRDGINQYKKRMPELIIKELKTFNVNTLRSNNNISICLSEEGKQFNSVELCSLLLNFKNKINMLRHPILIINLNKNLFYRIWGRNFIS